jgi:hypothetical protein
MVKYEDFLAEIDQISDKDSISICESKIKPSNSVICVPVKTFDRKSEVFMKDY